MYGAGRHGKPEEELFIQRPNTDPETPTIKPLRINKRDSASPPPRTGSALSQHNGLAQPTRKQTVPLPPETSSSPAPLPYPDERPRPQQRPSRDRTYQVPSSDRQRTATPDQGRTGSPAYPVTSSPPPLAINANRPPGAGYHGGARQEESREGQGQGQPSRLAERRGNAPKPLPDSPGPDLPDKDGLFAKPPQHAGEPQAYPPSNSRRRPSQAELNPYPDYHQQYWPPPAGHSDGAPQAGGLAAPTPSSVNRLSSTASTSTTRAQRGSPPPPETPIEGSGDQPGGGIEARYAAAGIAGTATLNSLQAQNAAAAQRQNQYTPGAPTTSQAPAGQHSQEEPPRRPWTPTEQPGSQPHGPPTIYQGPGEAPNTTGARAQPQVVQPGSLGQQTAPSTQASLEQDFQRMQMSHSPPPAYSSVSQSGQPSGSTAQGYPNEKHAPGVRPAVAGIAAGATGGLAGNAQNQGHPAFANDPRQLNGPSPQPGPGSQVAIQQYANSSPAPPGPGPASPPPLPEGWIAHLDPNSGQYYYIHLPTQSTQWEFPKGPTPLNLNEPLSPTLSTYGAHPLASPGISNFGAKPLASPGFPPQTAGYPESIMSMSVGTPTTAGFSGPPPSSGVDMYKVAPTNGVYFGPYLRYTNMDIERGLWLGSILLVTDAPQPPTIHIHQSVDLSPNREFR